MKNQSDNKVKVDSELTIRVYKQDRLKETTKVDKEGKENVECNNG